MFTEPSVSDDRALLAVTLLGESEEARRLVVSWPVAPFGDRDDPRVLLGWARVAGVTYQATEHWAPMLFEHAICRVDRTVDPAATRVIHHLAAQRLQARPTGGQKGKRA
jgi:hypothetical protein